MTTRDIINLATGEETQIALVPYATVAGAIEYLDEGATAPDGWSLATPEQLQAWQAKQAAAARAAAEAATLAKARAMRLDYFRVLDGLQVSAVWTAQQITVGGVQVPLAGAIETCKQQLRNITATDLSACATAAEMEAAIFAAYQAIAVGAPAEIQSAFQSLVP